MQDQGYIYIEQGYIYIEHYMHKINLHVTYCSKNRMNNKVLDDISGVAVPTVQVPFRVWVISPEQCCS